MKPLDRFLQRARIDRVRPWVPPSSRILDIGCFDGLLLSRLSDRIRPSVGIDPLIDEERSIGPHRLIPGEFPDDLHREEPFDAVTMLAVLEHIPPNRYADLRSGIDRHLKPGGRLLITVPSPRVDQILSLLRAAGLVDGMSLDEHHGYDVADTRRIFAAPTFEILAHRAFQLGLNNLFVFAKA